MIDNFVKQQNQLRDEIAAQTAAFLAAGKQVDVVPTIMRADKDEWTTSAKSDAENKPHKPVETRGRKPITTRWADSTPLARAAQARGGKAGAAAQRGTKKPR